MQCVHPQRGGVSLLVHPDAFKPCPMPIGYVEQGRGYGRQEETALSLWCLQDGLFVGHAAMVFTEMSEEAVRCSGEDRTAFQDS